MARRDKRAADQGESDEKEPSDSSAKHAREHQSEHSNEHGG